MDEQRINLDIDWQHGVIPISSAGVRLTKLVKQTQHGPVVITQKGRPAAVLLSSETFDALQQLMRGKE